MNLLDETVMRSAIRLTASKDARGGSKFVVDDLQIASDWNLGNNRKVDVGGISGSAGLFT